MVWFEAGLFTKPSGPRNDTQNCVRPYRVATPRQVPDPKISEKFSAGLRLARGDMTQTAFSKALGLNQQAYSRYEQGRLPSREALLRIAASLRLSPEDVLAGQIAGVVKPEPLAVVAGSTLAAATLQELEESLAQYSASVRAGDKLLRVSYLASIRDIAAELLRRASSGEAMPG